VEIEAAQAIASIIQGIAEGGEIGESARLVTVIGGGD
jgi:hypothetical protein